MSCGTLGGWGMTGILALLGAAALNPLRERPWLDPYFRFSCQRSREPKGSTIEIIRPSLTQTGDRAASGNPDGRSNI